ncbi:diacylglycerol/lipid kinase family protein [Methylovorus mays]|uniref:diacylglycerol/lipid kinase family protein n=1 Tax=Methylovorus mays TaxID=184077 RepID=UPI001E395184|nr:diacylglycerol kinase family protein [Methylovorus mays]MCB5207952.1 diacylglycerol kinase [Methylovorus mays]
MPTTTPHHAPFYVILNAGSGRHDTHEVRQTIQGIMDAAGRPCTIIEVAQPQDLSRIARETVATAMQHGGIVVAAGGDGAINAIVQEAWQCDCPMGILPQGTFNYFGRTHHIPEDTAEATRVLLTGRLQPVQIGLVNDKVFLVNASVGLYPQLLQAREQFKRQYGRSRVVALIAGFFTLLRQHRVLKIVLETKGVSRKLRTPTLFVGNNQLQLEQIGIPLTDALATGELAAIMLKPTSKLAMLGLMLKGALGRLGEAENIVSFSFSSMGIRQFSFPRRRIKVATDGEIVRLKSPLQFRVAPRPLQLIKLDEPA